MAERLRQMGSYPLCHQFKYLDWLGEPGRGDEDEEVSATTVPSFRLPARHLTPSCSDRTAQWSTDRGAT